MDFITNLLISNGCDFIWVMVNPFTKMAHFVPVEIWCLILYLFHRLGELTLIVPCYFGHSSVNLGYKIAL